MMWNDVLEKIITVLKYYQKSSIITIYRKMKNMPFNPFFYAQLQLKYIKILNVNWMQIFWKFVKLMYVFMFSFVVRSFPLEVGPASVMVGNMVQGVRLASAQGRDIGVIDDDSDTARKYQFISEILKWRVTTTADHVIFTLFNAKVNFYLYAFFNSIVMNFCPKLLSHFIKISSSVTIPLGK